MSEKESVLSWIPQAAGDQVYIRAYFVISESLESEKQISQAKHCAVFSEFNWSKIPDATGNEETMRATRLKVSANG